MEFLFCKRVTDERISTSKVYVFCQKRTSVTFRCNVDRIEGCERTVQMFLYRISMPDWFVIISPTYDTCSSIVFVVSLLDTPSNCLFQQINHSLHNGGNANYLKLYVRSYALWPICSNYKIGWWCVGVRKLGVSAHFSDI